MPGKKPKERQRYMLRINDTFVEVTRAVYLAWYQAGRKERYQVEKCRGMGYAAWRNYRKKAMTALFGSITGRNRYQIVRNTGTGKSSGIFD